MVEDRKGKKSLACSLQPFYKTLIPPTRADSSWPNTSKVHLLLLLHWEASFNMNFGRIATIHTVLFHMYDQQAQAN
jgi:hypothetical protein